ncbi:MAG TPA: DUF167 domain-containing protein [Candidatus Binatia bacterium]|jgi:uncharacterized protein (TIGR00251 family)
MGLRIAVSVKPNAKKTAVLKLSDGEYRVAVRAPAREGKANEAVVDLIADYFGVAKSAVKIIRGHASRHKLLEIG